MSAPIRVKKFVFRGLIGLLASLPLVAQAQLPLTISDLLVDRDSFKLATQFSHRQQREPAPFDLAPGGTIQRRLESNAMATRLRWGATANLEFNTTLSYQALQTRHWPRDTAGQTRHALSAGGTWQLHAEDAAPALLVSLDVELLGQSSESPAGQEYGRAQTLGMTTYRSLDPLVLSLSAAYTNWLSLASPEGKWQPGNVLRIQPRVNFAVNHRVSLVGGASAEIRQAARLEGRTVSPREARFGVLLGLGMQFGRRATLFAETEFATAGEEAAAVSLEWVYRF